MALLTALSLLIILWINGIYSFSYIIDEWGAVLLPFRTNYCQHSLSDPFPVHYFTIYQCIEKDSVPMIEKKIYDKSLCDANNYTFLEIINSNSNSNTNTNTTTTSSIEYDCNDDIASIENMDEYVISIHAICDLDPPAQRDVYLAINQCFLLSNKTIISNNNNITTITHQTLYASLDCDFQTDDTYFVTNLYLNDPECNTDPSIIRKLPLLQCGKWLLENETDFHFDIMAKMSACGQQDVGTMDKFNGIIIITTVFIIYFIWI